MKKFLYVFGKRERDVLFAEGYLLLQADEDRGLYVFANREDKNFMSFFANVPMVKVVQTDTIAL